MFSTAAHTNLAKAFKMESHTDKLRNEIIAVMWRYSQESDVTIIETIKAAHQAAERIAQIALDAKESD
jgi:hypothetical protein